MHLRQATTFPREHLESLFNSLPVAGNIQQTIGIRKEVPTAIYIADIHMKLIREGVDKIRGLKDWGLRDKVAKTMWGVTMHTGTGLHS